MNLQEIIHQTFAGTERPSGEIFVTAHSEGADELMAGACWQDLCAAALQNHCACVHFLSSEGFAYFLPAFMLAALTEPGIADSLLARLAPPKDDPSRPSYASWWQLLSVQQQLIVIAVIHQLLDQGATFSAAALAALRATVANASVEAGA